MSPYSVPQFTDANPRRDECCICGRKLIYAHSGTEGGLKSEPYCPIHSTRGTQHLRDTDPPMLRPGWPS